MAKGKIITVGIIENGVPLNWHFDCTQSDVAGIEIQPDRSILYAGWSIAELQEILEMESPEKKLDTNPLPVV